MATHLMDLKCGGRTYYISHGGETTPDKRSFDNIGSGKGV